MVLLSRFAIPLLFFLFILILPPYCYGNEASPDLQNARAKAGIGTSRPILRIGISPEQNLFSQRDQYEPLLNSLAQQLKIKIEAIVLPHYTDLIDNFDRLHLDGGFFGSLTGALAISQLNLVPIARPEFPDGANYYGMILARKHDNLHSAAALKGKRLALVDPATTAGYLLPLAYFSRLEIPDYKEWFGEVYFSGTHENAILDLLNEKADICAAKNTVFERLLKKYPQLGQEIEILAVSPKVPSNSLCLRGNLPEKLLLKIRKSLLNMHQSKNGRQILNQFGATRFLKTTKNDYQPVFHFADLIGLSLSKYATQ